MSQDIRVLRSVTEFRAYRHSLSGQGARGPIGFVPTMGALHEGHAALVRQARQLADQGDGGGGGGGGRVVASIFVNPTQFVPGEDYNKYPRTLEADVALLESVGCDAVFAPSAQEMYPGLARWSTEQSACMTSIDPGPLGNVLEGAIRPGHFRGVCSVVAKLLLITQPTHLFMGQKDYQQQLVLRRMIEDLNFPVELVRCATVREPDGLALSSRNRYLSNDERRRAGAISQSLFWAKDQWAHGERAAAVLDSGLRQRLQAQDLEVQYAVACQAQTLEVWKGPIAGPCVLLIAAKAGATRLIDNVVLGE